MKVKKNNQKKIRLRKLRKKFKTPKTLQKRLKNNRKRLTTRKTRKKLRKKYHSVENWKVNKNNQKKIRTNIQKATKKA